MLTIEWPRAFGLRLRRQGIAPAFALSAAEVAGRVCGVQAQVPGAAALAIAVRRTDRVAGLAPALAAGDLIRTWSVRGTLHVLPPAVAARQLSLLAAAKTWHRGSWQRTFAPLEVMSSLAELVRDALADGPLTREELIAAITENLPHPDLVAQLQSGWSAVLKPLAWQGVLCQGPPRGQRVTFIRPDQIARNWTGLPDPDVAGPQVVRDYLSAFGPATIDSFEQWLLRGAGRGSLSWPHRDGLNWLH
jgi:hypothetical protein